MQDAVQGLNLSCHTLEKLKQVLVVMSPKTTGRFLSGPLPLRDQGKRNHIGHFPMVGLLEPQ